MLVSACTEPLAPRTILMPKRIHFYSGRKARERPTVKKNWKLLRLFTIRLQMRNRIHVCGKPRLLSKITQKEEQRWSAHYLKKSPSSGRRTCELASRSSRATFRVGLDSTAQLVTYMDAGNDSASTKSSILNLLGASVNSQSPKKISTSELLVKWAATLPEGRATVL